MGGDRGESEREKKQSNIEGRREGEEKEGVRWGEIGRKYCQI